MPPADPTRRVAPHRRYAKKFLTLPDELLTKISDAVAPKDLPNFRLTCKTLANVSAKHFGEKRLAHRRFVFTEYSMRGLIDMTAHPVFGPCVKSIMFGTHWLTKDLNVLMDALKKHNITDDAEAMIVLRIYDERRVERAKFYVQHLQRLLSDVIANLERWGSKITLGIFDDIQLGLQKKVRHVRAYGSGREIKDLPFVRMTPAPRVSLQVIQNACRFVTFRPERLVLDLGSEEMDIDTEIALCSFVLNAVGQLRPAIDTIITTRYAHIGIIPSLRLLELKQKYNSDQDSCEPMWCSVSLHIFESPLRRAILSAPFRRLSIKSCSVDIDELIMILQAFAATLQVVELIDVYLWVQNKYDAGGCIRPVLCCLKDDLQLRNLILDNVRAMHIDYSDGIVIAKERSWSQQTIGQILDVLIDHDMYAWDHSESEDENEDGGEAEAENEDEGEAEDEENEGDNGANSWSRRERVLRRRAQKAKALALAVP
ncbi:hypothetical protein KCU95_g9310, partial [Aureobasidium melanogenum]